MNETDSLNLQAIPGIPLIQPGDDLTQVILTALSDQDTELKNGDVLVISSKIVSKAEGRYVDLTSIQPSRQAERLAEETHKDPRIVELVLQESNTISRKAPNVLVTEHRLGFISANAGIDQSNVSSDSNQVLLLPQDPDRTADSIKRAMKERTGLSISVVISDSHGRPFRLGNIGVAIGLAGVPALVDLRGAQDLFGRNLQISVQGFGDLVASAAHLVCGEGGEGKPVVLVRGLNFTETESYATQLNRPPSQDLYR